MEFSIPGSCLADGEIGAGRLVISNFKSLIIGSNTLYEAELNIFFLLYPFCFYTIGYFLKILVEPKNMIGVPLHPDDLLAVHCLKISIVVIIEGKYERPPDLLINLFL